MEYREVILKNGSTILYPLCGHEWCQSCFAEVIGEANMTGEICCGVFPCGCEQVLACYEKGEKVKKFTIAGTGSRELVQDQSKFAQVLEYLTDLLAKARAKHGENLQVVSGMAEGFDEALAKAAMANGISLLAAIPNRGYSKYYWKDHSLTDMNRFKDFQELASYADSTGGVVYTCGCTKNQPAKCGHWDGRIYNFTRNEWMVDQADIVWVYNPATKGTGQAYSYAKSKGIRTYLIPVVS